MNHVFRSQKLNKPYFNLKKKVGISVYKKKTSAINNLSYGRKINNVSPFKSDIINFKNAKNLYQAKYLQNNKYKIF